MKKFVFALTAAFALLLFTPAPKAEAQIGISIGVEPACPYGYYGYGPGYYAPAYVAPAPYVGGDAVSYCAQRFRSYDPYSGTYVGYDGFRHPCP